MSSGKKHFIVLVGGLGVITVLALVFTLTERYYAAALCVNAQMLWMLAFLAYTVLIHSKKRWPNRSVSERLYSILAMKD